MRIILLISILLSSAWAGPKLVVLEAIGPTNTPISTLMDWTDTVRGVVRAHAPPRIMVLTRENIEAFLPPGVDLADCEGECEITTGRSIGAEYVVGIRVVRAETWKVTVALHATIDGRFLGQGQARIPAEALDAGLTEAARKAMLGLTPPPQAARGAAREIRVHARPLKWLGAPILRVRSDLDVPLVIHAKGRRIGRTPVNLLLEGETEISLMAEAGGYQTRRFRVVTGGGSGETALTLPSTRARVRLDVPFPDVVVHLSGLSLQGREHFVEAGTYAVKVKHQCMEAPVFEATFKAGAEIDLAVPHRITCGNVRLTSAIPGVEIQWRGTWHDLPFETPLEPPWTTTVKARAPGHRSQLVSVENPPEGTRAVEVKLPPDRIDVRIDVRRWDDTPCNAPIHIDGQRVGRSPWRGEVSPGRHVITADCGAQLTHTGRFERSAKPIDVRLRQEGPRTEFVLTSTAFNSALLTLRRWSANRRVGGLRASLGLSIGGFGFRDEPAGGLGIEIGAAYAFRSWFEVGLSALGAAGSRTCSATESSPGSHTCYHAYGELRATARAYWGGLVVEGGLGQAGQLYDERSAGRLGPQFGVGLSF